MGGYIDENWYGLLSPTRMGAVVKRVGYCLVLLHCAASMQVFPALPMKCIARVGESGWSLYDLQSDENDTNDTVK